VAWREAEAMHMYAALSQRDASNAVAFINDARLLLSECYREIIEFDFIHTYIHLSNAKKKLFFVVN
jgi:hypothetical protein